MFTREVFSSLVLLLPFQLSWPKANDLFLRNLQALREMKASPITIKIEQAGQVNVGEKQLNVAATPSRRIEGQNEKVAPAQHPALPEESSDGGGAR